MLKSCQLILFVLSSIMLVWKIAKRANRRSNDSKRVLVISLVLFIMHWLVAQNPELVIQNSHTDDISKMTFNASGDRLVTVGADQTIKIWDVKARKLLRNIDGFTENEILNVQFGHEDKSIITLEDNKLRYFDASTGEQQSSYKIDSGAYSSRDCYVLQSIPELGLVALSWGTYADNYIEFRNLESGAFNQKLGDHETKIVSVQYNPKSKSVIYADYNHLYEYNLSDNSSREIYTYKKTRDAIANMQIANGSIYILSSDGNLTILDDSRYKRISQEKIIDYRDYFYLINHPFHVTDRGEVIYHSSDKNYQDRLHKIHSSANIEIELEERVKSMAFENNNNWIAISQAENVFVYSLDKLSLVFSFRNITNWYKIVEPVKIRGSFLASPYNTSNIYYWNLMDGSVSMHTVPGAASDIAINPADLEFALSDGYNNYMINLPEFKVSDTNMITDDVEYISEMFPDAYILPPGEYNIVFSEDGNTFVTQFGKKCGVKLWDRKTLTMLKGVEIDDESQVIEHMDFRSDLGLVLVETSNNMFGNYKTVLVDLEKGKVIKEWEGNINSKFFTRSAKAFIQGGIIDLLTDSLSSIPGYSTRQAYNTNPDISRREKYLAYCYGDSVLVVDMINNNYSVSGVHKDLEGVQFMYNETRFISYGRDGTLKLWDAEKKELIATLIAESRNEWENDNSPLSYLIVTPDGYFMGPKKLYDLVAYNVDNQVYSFDQFDEIFNRPDIVLDRLGYAPKRLVEAYKQAHLKRQNNALGHRITLEDLPDLKVTILNKNSIPASSNQKTFSFSFRLNDPTTDISGYNVWVNGVAKYNINFKNISGEGNSQTINEEIELVSGNNYIEIAAINRENEVSLKEIIEIDYTGPQEKDLYVIGIGMSTYFDSTFNLTYPQKDVNDFIELQSISTFFNKIRSLKLIDDEFTRSSYNVIEEFLADAGPDDQAVLFYAGHGMLDSKNDYFLATWDVDFYNPSNTGFPFDTLEFLFNQVESREKIILVDACHSGLVDQDTEDRDHSSDGENSNVQAADRSRRQAASSRYQNDPFEMMQALFVNLNKGTGTTIISAAGGTQFAYESEEYSNGLFTYSYLDGMKSGKADFNKDGNITISEIKNYCEEMVLELSDGLQKPALRQMNYYNDFTVWSANDTEVNRFYTAASNNDVHSLQLALDKNIDIRSIDESNNFTALHYAARQGSDNVINFLISKGAEVDAVANFGWTPLYLAVHNNHLNTALLLLQAGADKNAKNYTGVSLVDIAGNNGNRELKELLANSETILPRIELHQSGFITISSRDSLAFAAFLDTPGVDINFLHPGFSLGFLHSAAYVGDIAILKLLLQRGADINLLTGTGVSALMLAVYTRNNTLIEYLLESGADKSFTDKDGNDAYFYADEAGKKILDAD